MSKRDRGPWPGGSNPQNSSEPAFAPGFSQGRTHIEPAGYQAEATEAARALHFINQSRMQNENQGTFESLPAFAQGGSLPPLRFGGRSVRQGLDGGLEGPLQLAQVAQESHQENSQLPHPQQLHSQAPQPPQRLQSQALTQAQLHPAQPAQLQSQLQPTPQLHPAQQRYGAQQLHAAQQLHTAQQLRSASQETAPTTYQPHPPLQWPMHVVAKSETFTRPEYLRAPFREPRDAHDTREPVAHGSFIGRPQAPHPAPQHPSQAQHPPQQRMQHLTPLPSQTNTPDSHEGYEFNGDYQYSGFERRVSPEHENTETPETPKDAKIGSTSVDHMMLYIQALERGASPSELNELGKVIPPDGRVNGGVDKRARKKLKYACEFQGCTKSFVQRTHLLVHYRSHTGERPFRCTYPGCEKWFSQMCNLTTHLRTHTGEKPYVCGTCGRRFAQQGNLRNHTLVHGNQRPLVCKLDKCMKTFNQLGNLKGHQNNAHLETVMKFTKRLQDPSAPLLSPEEIEMFEYFKSLYRNANCGIKGRGKGSTQKREYDYEQNLEAQYRDGTENYKDRARAFWPAA